MQGWVKIHRKFLDWEWFDDTEAVKLFLILLLSANHADGNWRGVPIKRGQLITGINSLSEKSNLSIKIIRNRLKKLEKTGEIVRQTGNQYSIITICKYDEYQSEDNGEGKQTGSQRASKGQAKGKQRATNKNDKNDKNAENDKNINISFDDFWNLYDKKIAKPVCQTKWNKLKDEERSKIMETLPEYLKTVTDKKYQPNPQTYLNQRRWEDEIIPLKPNGKRSPQAEPLPTAEDHRQTVEEYFQSKNK